MPRTDLVGEAEPNNGTGIPTIDILPALNDEACRATWSESQGCVKAELLVSFTRAQSLETTNCNIETYIS